MAYDNLKDLYYNSYFIMRIILIIGNIIKSQRKIYLLYIA